MSSKSNSAAIRRRVGASAVSNISAPAAPTPTPSSDRVHIGDLIVSHDRALAELRRTVADQAEQIAGLTEQIEVLQQGATVKLGVEDGALVSEE
jgi:hypothetical protein